MLTARLACPEEGWEIPAHSLVAAFLQLLLVLIRQASATIINQGGTPTTVTPQSFLFDSGGPAQFGDGHLVVGSGTTPVDIEDFALDSKINPDGLNYGLGAFSTWVRNDNSGSISLSRTFTNTGGGNQFIREVGWLAVIAANVTALMFREVIPEIVMTPGLVRTISLTITISAG